jgi:hypothetical protein
MTTFAMYIWTPLINKTTDRETNNGGQRLKNHRLSINRSTKRGKEKSPSNAHCQREKEMDDLLLASQQFFKNSATM